MPNWGNYFDPSQQFQYAGGAVYPGGAGGFYDPSQLPQTGGAEPVPAAPAPGQPAPFDPTQQVGHDGTINGMTREQYRDAWMSSGATNTQAMDAFLAAHGGRRLNDSGVVTTPFGETLDMGGAFRSGHGSAAWSGMDGGGNGGPISVGSGQTPAAVAAGGGFGGYGGGGGAYSGMRSRFADAIQPVTYDKFDPSSVDVTQDPGYAFRLAQGAKALQNSAASKGNLLTGDFAKALTDYNQGAASQEYGNAFNRAFQTNQANNAGRLAAFGANVGADQGYGNLDLGNLRAGNDYSLGVGQLALGNKSADQSFYLGNRNADIGMFSAQTGRIGTEGNLALGAGQLQQGWANYGLNANQQNFNQGYSLANMGLNAAGMYGNAGQAYGQGGANTITGAGNAQAAGSIAGGNAWGQAFSGAGNAALQGYYANQYARPGGSQQPMGYEGYGF